MTIHIRPRGGGSVDERTGVVHRAQSAAVPSGDPDEIDGVIYRRMGGTVEHVGGQLIRPAGPRTPLDAVPVDQHRDRRASWPFIRGRLFTFGEIATATHNGLGPVSEYIDERTAVYLDDPPLTLLHKGRSRREPVTVADYVSGSAEILGREVWATWCLRGDVESAELFDLLTTRGGLPLSISFTEAEPAHIDEDGARSRTPLVRQTSISVKHVAVVGTGAYRSARLTALTRAS